MLGGQKSLIGVDIGSDSIKVVELKPKKRSYTLVNARQVPLSPDVITDGTIMDYGEVVNAVSSAFADKQFSHRNVATGLKGPASVASKLDLPIEKPKEIDLHFRWEAEQYMQFDVEEVSFDYAIMNQNEEAGTSEVILAAASRDLIVDFLSVLESATLRPVVVDLEVFSILNAFENANGLSKDVQIILNIGHSVTQVIFFQDGRFISSREIPRAGNYLNDMIMQATGGNNADALLLKSSKESFESDEDVRNIINSFNHQMSADIKNIIDDFISHHNDSPARMFVTGGTAPLPEFVNSVHEAAGINVSLFNPFNRIEVGKGVSFKDTPGGVYGMTVAVGLAMRTVKTK